MQVNLQISSYMIPQKVHYRVAANSSIAALGFSVSLHTSIQGHELYEVEAYLIYTIRKA